MFDPVDIVDFLDFLDSIDSISIEENQYGEDVTLNDIKSTNSGNNCLHYILMHNNHRIVIQTYKELKRKGDLDIVQGKPELEPNFEHMIDTINARPQDFTDNRLNKLFVLYCGIWCRYVTAFYWGDHSSFAIEFGPDMSLIWVDDIWLINVDNVTVTQIQQIFDFIKATEDICNG